jgi:hypothetical protein
LHTLGLAHSALGYIYSKYDWDWQGAEMAYKRAIKINGSDVRD